MKKITLMLGLILPALGFAQGDCASAEVVAPGVLYTLDAYIGELPTDVDCTEYGAGAAQANGNWYSYTATVDGVALITSDENLFPANVGIDTRLIVYTGECGALTCLASNDDVDFGNDQYTSSLILAVTAGTTYTIVWDDRWSDVAGFAWTVEELAIDCSTSFPYVTNFDDNVSFQGCWNTADLDGNGVSWIQQALDLDGDGTDETFATNGTSGAAPKNDWLFSPAFAMTAGNSYAISYSFNAADAGATNLANEILTAYIVNDPSEAFTFSQQIATTADITQQGTFETLEADAYTASGDFVPTTSGNYYLAFNTTSPANAGFLLLFNASIEESLSTPDFNNGKVRMFPNPVASELSVVAPNAIDSVEVYNMLGQKVASQTFSTNDVRMNVSGLTAGAYTVKVTSAGASQTMKIVKQ